MTRALIPIGECGLLSRRNAMRYCGCLGEEKFDRIVAPHVKARWLGGRRFYSRKELDAWIDGDCPRGPVLSGAELVDRLWAAGEAKSRGRPNPRREKPRGGYNGR